MVSDILNVVHGEGSDRYLGLPSLVRRNKRAILGFIKEKVAHIITCYLKLGRK